MLKRTITLLTSLCLFSLLPCWAQEEKTETESESKGGTNTMLGYRTSVSPRTLQYEGERALEMGNIERALTLLRRSIDMDDDDCNTRLIYAKAMEAKLKTQHERDPELFKECVKEFLIVMRDEVGDQKGVGIHGVNFMGSVYDDEEREMTAKKHLVKLTGYAPGGWETDAHYLNRVLRPSKALLNGKVMDEDKNKDEGEK